ncbi:hypothetical protein [Streptomyces albidoflavus]|nr:hypothetical protein [Streptomyces albidoflavus]
MPTEEELRRTTEEELRRAAEEQARASKALTEELARLAEEGK